jgi:glycerate 2-kinase
VEPERLLSSWLGRGPDGLLLRRPTSARDSRHAGDVLVVGAGKAVVAMTRAARAVIAGEARGVVIAPRGGTLPDLGGVVEVAVAGHPVPDAAGEAATTRLLEATASAGVDTLVLVLLSGGASALLVAPAPGLTLADKQAVTTRLLAAGADITSFNTVRKHCSRVKGGGLARAARGAVGLWALVLSDVVGDDPAIIASGPTVPDPSTYADAATALARYLDPGEVPPAIAAHIARGVAGKVFETLKPGDPLLASMHTTVIGGNGDAVAGAASAARARGYATEVLAAPLTGDASEAGTRLAARLLAAPRDRPVALVAGGETTVRVVAGGRGGRSQQLALAAAIALAGTPTVLLAAGTDGVDGPTDAAGACVDGETVTRARALGHQPAQALAATDSYPLLDATGDLVRTGPTGTNVADVVVALRPAC